MKIKNKKILAVALLLNLILFSGCTSTEVNDFTNYNPDINTDIDPVIGELKEIMGDDAQKQQIKVNTAVIISDQVKRANLQEIDLEKIDSFNNYLRMTDSLNLVIKLLNNNIGTGINFLGKDVANYDKFMMEVIRYTPLIDNYNEFILSCYNLDPSDGASVDILLIKSAKFTFEATLIFTGAYYGTAFATTGTFASTFGLTNLASVCSPCVSAAMSGIHWSIRNYMTEKTSDMFEKTLSGDYDIQDKYSKIKQLFGVQ